MWKRTVAMLPGIGISLLPKVVCPFCWPAYAGLLSSLGLGFLMSSTYLFPLTAVFLGIAVFALAFRARGRRGYGPVLVGLLGAAFVLYGKFSSNSNAIMYSGISVLVTASIWNTWPRHEVARARRANSQLVQLSGEK